MRGFSSPAAGYLLTCGLVAASLALATLADSKLGAPPPLRAGPLAGPALGGSGFEATGTATIGTAKPGMQSVSYTPASPPSAGLAETGAAPMRQWREAPSSPSVVLTALLVGRNDAARLALVAVNGEPAVAVRPGDLLPGGYKVLAMDGDSLTYQSGERQVRVSVDAGIAAAPTIPATLARPTLQPAAPNDAAPQPSGNDAFRQAVDQRLASLRR